VCRTTSNADRAAAGIAPCCILTDADRERNPTMATHLTAIVLHTTRKVYPVAYFVRYQGKRRTSREYRLTKARMARLAALDVSFVLSSDPGWLCSRMPLKANF
jgi:hypothetical protein